MERPKTARGTRSVPKPEQKIEENPTSNKMDNFDFHVSLPSLGFESDMPLIVLLGWAGAKEEHLAKYSAIYEERGIFTLRYTLPNEILFCKVNEIKPTSLKVLRLIYDLHLQHCSIIFHCFSNGGGFAYRYITEHVLQNEQEYHNLNIKGVIFDSCPGNPSLLRLFKAVFTSNHRRSCVYRLFLAISVTIHSFFSYVFEVIGWKPSMRTDYFEAMKYDASHWPALFLFSEADDICQAKTIREVMRVRENCGVEVSSHCWPDTPHVGHFRVHPEEYEEAVWMFLRKLLGEELFSFLFDDSE